ncbi:hypothetical protein HBH56_113260 [Parastagonospora nodorum]|uniref:RING-type domain-containing protein n=1 Tax=Phaeosphaeria nodorum (strain SN15 / ATCC MYA-4574 / FGSC 10173) TaxID=321614 RepID=A0A7U2FIL6_PHANO|nr:hypothetical protein HBH56_113260 [Parastagonospora nodorum]QRD03566.1 hypothetical protein JI435_103300 [Parastagonospora nodorum SN15]KAH3921562.1 hypothetical protein HBH54_239200 [Parastagonospora nodorum]KAH3979358.1 hypothetical protein HBH52_097300 [Parastagonospora nodorum]KAH4048642.1 hypothetical protein HBH49_149340 [Parastagonospora nodorum]
MPILYEDFVEDLRAVLPPTITPSDPSCHICNSEYGSLGVGVVSNLDHFNELPGHFRRIFIQNVVEPVTTPCGHNFCTFCICQWLIGKDTPGCPVCRTRIEIPQHLLDWYIGNDINDAVEGLCTSLHVFSSEAQEIIDVLSMSVRQLLTTMTPMLFLWNSAVFVSDLPKLMVSVARRFHYQAMRVEVPTDLPELKLHNPMDRLAGMRKSDKTKSLASFTREDAPLTDHPQSHEMYSRLCEHIFNVGDDLESTYERCFTQAEVLYLVIKKEMPDADGGVGMDRWDAYVQCVVDGLMVWQSYCERVNMLTARRVTRVFVDDERAAEGVWAYTVG